MPNNKYLVALGLEYEGTNYSGFQKQKSTKQTIQGLLDMGLKRVADQQIKSFCSGRTDSGVHALMQVIHFETNSSRRSDEWVRGVNSYLPHDIRVIWSREVEDTFHARFSALDRSYRYIIRNNDTPSALWSKRSLYIPQELDYQAMRRASKYLVGEHDFSSFRGSGCQSKTPIRNMKSIEIKKKKDLIFIDLKANAFLLHMVRVIVGTLIMVGKKEISPLEVKKILNLRDRKVAGKTVDSAGLYFVGPSYPKIFRIPKPNMPQF